MKIKLKLKPRTKKLASNIIHNKKIAMQYHDTRYYEAMATEIKNLPHKKDEVKKFATRHRKTISKFINQYKKLLEVRSQGVFNRLAGIYKKNRKAAFEGLPTPKHSNLLYMAASVPMLVTAYKKIRKNKGANTLGYILSNEKYNRLDARLKSFINKTFYLPDGMSKRVFIETSKILRSGQYPWGSSRRIYLDKPGKPGILRPITIPPFMDRVVQASITMVLQSIYEPWFEKSNCSFGYRPNKGVHDAIFSLTNTSTKGLNKALEGDIKSAYDKVCKDKLISILEKRITDRKFINLIKERLNYQYFDTIKQKYIEEKEGIPQGGIDSPYLWNIYMLEFDNFVQTKTTEILDELNKKVGAKTLRAKPPARKRKLERARSTTRFLIKMLNKFPQQHAILNSIFENKYEIPDRPKELLHIKQILDDVNWEETLINKSNTDLVKYRLIKLNHKFNHEFFNLPQQAENKRYLRFSYARYADDWILLTNAPTPVLNKLKQLYSDFLWSELKATLADDKTLITDIKHTPAHFLGFEIRTSAHNKLTRVIRSGKKYMQHTAGKKVFALPDRQRLISRLHMKGYCNKKGQPKEVGWLSFLEPYVIIERFNSVIRGLVNYYADFIETPQKGLGRWIYILRYACLKTLAQKYKCSIKKIFKKFPFRRNKFSWDNSKTIACTIIHDIEGKNYAKTWKLLTLKDALKASRKINRIKEVSESYYKLKNNDPVEYIVKNNATTAVTNDSFLDKIKWINLRTQASLDAPCCICGSEEDVQMHHLKHIRKQKYDLIPETQSWVKVMWLRNRKQIPVCKECHLNIIHQGKYGGTKLSSFAPKILYDNRLISLESHIHKGKNKDYTKSLEKKGWKIIQEKDKTGWKITQEKDKEDLGEVLKILTN
jgi:hypothetical protein